VHVNSKVFSIESPVLYTQINLRKLLQGLHERTENTTASLASHSRVKGVADPTLLVEKETGLKLKSKSGDGEAKSIYYD
jgi:hypothetical protein